jgi:hypothetical protein
MPGRPALHRDDIVTQRAQRTVDALSVLLEIGEGRGEMDLQPPGHYAASSELRQAGLPSCAAPTPIRR